MKKGFKSIEEQIRILESRGVSTDSNTATILRREGYYSVINGYKDPFINPRTSRAARDDRYVSGTTFDDIYKLFVFDRSLRELTFRYLIRVEALVKTACAYCFSESHRGVDDYLKPDSYATESEYAKFGLKNYDDNKRKLLNTLSSRVTGSRRDFISHYKSVYGAVPLWVLVNDLTFGNVQHLFNLMKPSEQTDVCQHIAIATDKLGSKRHGYFPPREARTTIDYLVKYRNICAHDDRLYCAKVGAHRECDYASMLMRVERFLPVNEYEELVGSVVRLINEPASSSPTMEHLIRNMGFDPRLNP